jgi:hypothetical protein
MEAVRQRGPEGLSLRDKDRYLWGRSFADDLEYDLETAFGSSVESDIP